MIFPRKTSFDFVSSIEAELVLSVVPDPIISRGVTSYLIIFYISLLYTHPKSEVVDGISVWQKAIGLVSMQASSWFHHE